MLLIPAAPCTVLSTHWYLMAAGPGARSAMVGLRSDLIPLPHRVLGIRNGDTRLKVVPCPPPVLHLSLHQLQVWSEVGVGWGGCPQAANSEQWACREGMFLLLERDLSY